MNKKFARGPGYLAITYAGLMGLLLGVGAATAQSDWLKQGKDLLGTMGTGTSGTQLSSGEVGAGLKEALRVGTGNVVSKLGSPGGFNNDPAVHIPLPKTLNTARAALEKVGMGASLVDLETKINLAAEAATPKAKQLFLDAISQMTLDDAKGIYSGPNDAATRYFQGKMSAPLAKEMSPIVQGSLSEVGAVQSYDNVMAKYSNLPFMPDAKTNLSDYVVEKGTDGIFHYLAIEEANIRTNPAGRTTDLLKQVFGSK